MLQRRGEMEFKDSKKFLELLQQIRGFIEKGLLIDKNPPKDIIIFLEVINELKKATESVANEDDWVKFFFEYTDDIKLVLDFVENIRTRAPRLRKA